MEIYGWRRMRSGKEQMKKYQRKIIVARGDTQSGHAGGLLNPDTVFPTVDVDEGGRRVIIGYEPAALNAIQKRMWAWTMEDLANVRSLAGKDEVIFIEMGDMTQGNRFIDDLSETALSRQVWISFFNSKPWLEIPNVKRMRAVRGTGVHVWGEGSTETILTWLLQREYPNKDISIADHYLLNVDHFMLDVSHHGPGAGLRNWTRGNAFELYVKSILLDDLNAQRNPPDVVLRAHKHEFTYAHAVHQVNGRVWQLPAFIVPPQCFIGSHAQKAVNSPSSMGVGTLALEIMNGKLHDWHAFTHYVDLRTEELL
jgi:hypothetical protein